MIFFLYCCPHFPLIVAVYFLHNYFHVSCLSFYNCLTDFFCSPLMGCYVFIIFPFLYANCPRCGEDNEDQFHALVKCHYNDQAIEELQRKLENILWQMEGGTVEDKITIQKLELL